MSPSKTAGRKTQLETRLIQLGYFEGAIRQLSPESSIYEKQVAWRDDVKLIVEMLCKKLNVSYEEKLKEVVPHVNPVIRHRQVRRGRRRYRMTNQVSNC